MPNTKNFSYSTILTAPSPASSGTSLVVQSGDGAKFPPVPFPITIWPAGVRPTSSNAEIATVTGISTDTFTITRAQEDSSARSVIVGDQVAATHTANSSTLNNIFTSQSATTQNITLTASTNFLTHDALEIGGSYTFEVPATSLLEIDGYLTPASPIPAQNLSYTIKFSVYKNAAQNTSAGSFAKVNFDTKHFDTGNNFDPGTNFNFTAPVAGFYFFHAKVYTASDTRVICSLFKNGAEWKRGFDSVPATAVANSAQVTDLVQLALGDTIDARVFTTNSVALTVGGTGVNTYMSGFMLGTT